MLPFVDLCIADENINATFTSHLAMGGIIGSIVTAILSYDRVTALCISLVVALVFSVVYVSSGIGCIALRNKSLRRYYPRLGAILFTIVGAGAIPANWDEAGTADAFTGATLIVALIGHGAHVCGMLLLLLSYIATLKHFGIQGCKRCHPHKKIFLQEKTVSDDQVGLSSEMQTTGEL